MVKRVTFDEVKENIDDFSRLANLGEIFIFEFNNSNYFLVAPEVKIEMKDHQAFIAPTSGFYKIREEATLHKDTGMTEVVPNPKRKYFFQFWIPKTIEQKVYEVVYSHSEEVVRYLHNGETVQSTIVPIRLE